MMLKIIIKGATFIQFAQKLPNTRTQTVNNDVIMQESESCRT